MKQEKRTPTVVRRRDDAPRAEAPRTSTVRRRADAPSGGSGVKGNGLNQWVTAGFAAFSVLVVIGVIGALIAPDREEDPAALSSPSGITWNNGGDLQGAGQASAAPTPTTEPSGPPENGTYTLPCGMEFQFWDEVRNDVTGRWRRAATSDSFVPADYALEYYEMMFSSDDEIHSIWNATLGTTTRITVAFGTLYVDTFEYVKGEEHDAKLMFSGTLLDSRMVDIESGEPLETPTQTGESEQLISELLSDFYSEEQILSVSVADGKAEVKILTDFSGSAWSEDWESICEKATSAALSLRESIPESNAKNVIVYLENINKDILLTVSNGKVMYNGYEKPAPTPSPSSGDGGSGSANNFNTYDNDEQKNTTESWVLNTSTMKIHYPSCSQVSKIAPQNYSTSSLSESELKEKGYTTCGVCH